MKRITTVLTVLGCSLLCATAANAADITSSGYAGGTNSVSGTTDGQTPVRIEILKNGCVFDDLTLENASESYYYNSFMNSDRDGAYSFDIAVPTEPSNYSVRLSFFDGTSLNDTFATYTDDDMNTAIASYISSARTAGGLKSVITSYYGGLSVDYSKYKSLGTAKETEMFNQLESRITGNASFSVTDFKTFIKAFFLVEDLNSADADGVVSIIDSNAECLGIDTASATYETYTAMTNKTAFATALKAKQCKVNELPREFKNVIIFSELKNGLWNEQIEILEKYDADTNISDSDWGDVTSETKKKSVLSDFRTAVINGTVDDIGKIKTKINKLIADYVPPRNSGSTGGSSSSSSSGISSSVSETPVVTEAKLPFDDIADVEWAKIPIIALNNLGIINGKADNQYCPNDTLTREELAVMITRAFGLTSTESSGFSDVPQDRWSADAISAAKQAGIVSGISDTEFCPTAEITRQDIAVILYRAAVNNGKTMEASTKKFADADSISDYAKDAVSALYGAGIISGTNNGFEPSRNATRAEAAKMIYGILEFCEVIK